MERANAANVPKDRIERALKRLQGGEATDSFEEVRYEGYGAGGVAILVECLTDNRNRTVSEVRHAFAKSGGNLGADGAVAYLFRRVGILQYPLTPERAEALFERALDAGAEDVEDPGDGSLTVTVDPEFFESVRSRLEAAGFTASSGEVTLQASIQVPVSGDDALSVLKLMANLEELDDVQNLYSNADFSEEAIRRFQDAS
jgi:YebC/PmpR family DNA-binding regulatory protein